VHAIVHPLAVRAEVGDRGLDLHDRNFAVRAERREVGAPARGERQLAHHAIAVRVQKPRGAARDLHRSLRLPPVDQKLGRGFPKAHEFEQSLWRFVEAAATQVKPTHDATTERD
jgi:hypothetical protein